MIVAKEYEDKNISKERMGSSAKLPQKTNNAAVGTLQQLWFGS
jgi:hypothetical protein